MELGFIVQERKVWYGSMRANELIVAHPQAMNDVSRAVETLAKNNGLRSIVKYE